VERVRDYARRRRPLFSELEDVYIAARYTPRVYTEEDARDIVSFVRKVIEALSRSYSEILAELLGERRRLLEDWKRIAAEAARAVRELYPDARVYVAGSLVEGRATAASDIDLLVVLPHQPTAREAAMVIAHIWEKLGLPLSHPLEVHVVSRSDLEKYRRRGRLVEVTG